MLCLQSCVFFFFYRLFPKLSNAIRPFHPVLSVLDTTCCVGAPLALNINSVVSPFGATIVLLVTMFHLSAFLSGYFLTGSVFRNAPDSKALQRTLSYETGNELNQLFGMQSSLLALALATKPLFVLPTRRQAAAALNYHYDGGNVIDGVHTRYDMV
ncbi:hypothetical protein F2Q70_00032925 [Brassica cretica]|uniref:Uncharacterized protein n=1 Tax=Brassica cretica TaxID=69181 RepID=A0A8S9FKC4_BRACR|nr:hypothetical protein F2Q70_00032925 [Brassica cretica]